MSIIFFAIKKQHILSEHTNLKIIVLSKVRNVQLFQKPTNVLEFQFPHTRCLKLTAVLPFQNVLIIYKKIVILLYWIVYKENNLE